MATYAVVFELQKHASVSVGALGEFCLVPGYYIYVGQARRGVDQRLGRHFRREKRLRWHVDYLGEVATPVESWIQGEGENVECLWADTLASLPAARRSLPHFGSSDCRCPGHLVYVPQRPAVDQFQARLQELGENDRNLLVKREP